ncbi:hypothetical protein UA08_07167 [Talaromyces atroroseus]|uniref:Transmembrane protein 19 n=1 Tax=Talaromyces atroroseus TaxID=1441469 RepID=A0A225A9B1_TALAT|nr:hypothetical protein UA08_07167 [Talaromyces atroroseus]OKL57441.1 hypothetical protein UA08_07167 [Talaromyces atroroseus]
MVNPAIAVPAVSALVFRAWSRKTLTPAGIFAAATTAVIHVLHPWILPFLLLTVFYLGGSQATKVKHDIKAQLTLSASGARGGEGARNHLQVLANSIVATVIVALHIYFMWKEERYAATCFAQGADIGDVFVIGFIANYAAVAADTFSSELGILSKTPPRLITSPTLKVVPPGTNGGVTLAGLLAGVFGAFTVALTSVLFVPFCAESWSLFDRLGFVIAVTVWGTLGSLLDSFLGGFLQASVVDKRTGKVVEGDGGRKVLVRPSSTKPSATTDSDVAKYDSDIHATESTANAVSRTATSAGLASAKSQQPSRVVSAAEGGHNSRKVETGFDILDNNAVNVLMAAIMSVGAMVLAGYYWNIPLQIGEVFS